MSIGCAVQAALANEARLVDEARAVALAKRQIVAWNASDFEVHYATVDREVKVRQLARITSHPQ